MNDQSKMNLLNFNRQLMRDFFVSIGEKSFRGDQLLQWIHQYGFTDFDSMTNLSFSLRKTLKEKAEIIPPKIIREQISKDGTRKWLFQLHDNHCIETVFIPEVNRGTLCVSSQVGCPLGCKFCSTGDQGFKRNLDVSEIVGQVWQAVRVLSTDNKKHDRHITNIVLMGMGEPLLNFDSVITAMDIMMDDLAYGLSKYKVTLSTSGLVPEMDRLSEVSDVSLAVSLHAPNDELRNQLVPINKKYPLKELLAACKRFFKNDKRRKVAFEYIMISGVNDRSEHAKQLVKILQGIPCKVNLIPYNPQKNSSIKPSTPEALETFRNILMSAGINTITRKTRGADIDAACGQLAGLIED